MAPRIQGISVLPAIAPTKLMRKNSPNVPITVLHRMMIPLDTIFIRLPSFAFLEMLK